MDVPQVVICHFLGEISVLLYIEVCVALLSSIQHVIFLPYLGAHMYLCICYKFHLGEFWVSHMYMVILRHVLKSVQFQPWLCSLYQNAHILSLGPDIDMRSSATEIRHVDLSEKP